MFTGAPLRPPARYSEAVKRVARQSAAVDPAAELAALITVTTWRRQPTAPARPMARLSDSSGHLLTDHRGRGHRYQLVGPPRLRNRRYVAHGSPVRSNGAGSRKVSYRCEPFGSCRS